ncbi:pyrroloquinoline quinone biosynthesis peptide chaperone PqqD [Gluconobacter cerinus]|uniref:pyrroloquinoline quinone biosynthesis peptide chaperone PqqD n=1 Tax=Gluconobacter TaxID=441 RepID=UPI00062CAA14|nr:MULTISPECIES: pyrroloquinoline quinone biosynthesis peptide chaperone PqqD [Gluconobacter]MBS1037890.1 pyrroloquinoline quinone biosynthesis peptide chaperone PqqD [Gluconobacter cerinus]MBS1040588.1 pyrroloquinoline quinone biosynthesis peptide chaperone PqqD [Gluconobacter cerinus]MBS1047177.1 pyrroloquinoline quinone biosynthesis peptide chaperone PqqD [Gluconobacter cerinus]OUJ08798.1 pyrroloquinoline quinone biosynthesis protein PqqD [Gluconobacter sp. DsW_058]
MSVTEETVLSFARGHRLQHDRVRDVWLVQAPEKAFIIEGAAPHILGLVDGELAVGSIVEKLTEQFSAPREVISADVLALLSDLTEKGVLRA